MTDYETLGRLLNDKLVRLIYQRPDYCKIMSVLVDITEEWIENDYLSCNLEIIARITNRVG